jgi:Phage tail tube protein, GTA-gp10
VTNPWAGEVEVMVDGTAHVGRLTLGALAELETRLGTGTIVELVERFERAAFSSADVLAVIVAGLRGGGLRVTAEDLLSADVCGGPVGAAKVAAELLTRAFALPG